MAAAVYDYETGCLETDGLQSGLVCDQAVIVARSIARENGRVVVVEDRGTRECYRVTPAGKILPAPRWWRPEWDWEGEE